MRGNARAKLRRSHGVHSACLRHRRVDLERARALGFTSASMATTTTAAAAAGSTILQYIRTDTTFMPYNNIMYATSD